MMTTSPRIDEVLIATIGKDHRMNIAKLENRKNKTTLNDTLGNASFPEPEVMPAKVFNSIFYT